MKTCYNCYHYKDPAAHLAGTKVCSYEGTCMTEHDDERKGWKPMIDVRPGAVNIFRSQKEIADILAKRKAQIEAAETGLKYDDGKPRIGEMLMDFAQPLLQICKVWEFGAKKYKKSNWKKVENGWNRYTNAMSRHQLLEEEEYYDQETGLPHAVHVAWNAMARLFFLPEEIEE